MTPKLVFERKTYPPSQSTIQKLDFRIDPSTIFPAAAFQDPTQIHYTDGELQIPFTEYMTSKVATFKILLGLLPETAGKITMIWSEQKKAIETKLFTSRTIVLKTPRTLQVRNLPLDFAPDSGWKVKTGQSRTNVTVSRNAAPLQFKCDSADKVTYLVNLRRNAHLQFTVHFPMWREVVETENYSQVFPLNWGDSTFFEPPKWPWKIIFEAFNGTKWVLTENHLSTPFLKLVKVGSGYKMTLIGPESSLFSKL